MRTWLDRQINYRQATFNNLFFFLNNKISKSYNKKKKRERERDNILVAQGKKTGEYGFETF